MAQHATLNKIPSQEIDTDFDLLGLHELNPERYPFLLESTSVRQPALSSKSVVTAELHDPEYDLLMAFPGDRLVLSADETLLFNDTVIEGDFLTALDHRWQVAQQTSTPTAFPFQGGWFLYLGYELAAQIEPKLQLRRWHGSLPIAAAVRIPAAVIREHQSQRTWIVAEAGQEACLQQMLDDIDAASRRPANREQASSVPLVQEPPAQDYCTAVEKIRDYIYAGDVFQVNLSRRWSAHAPPSLSVDELYSRLRDTNPAPFAGLAYFGEATIVSSSPERLVRTRGNKVETRPIAGTRPRSGNTDEDQALLSELLQHPKERAEHIMLIDLERNDLGRLCEPGSVRVEELMGLESYAHVHHIVSNVTGILRAGVTPAEVIRAVFPGGTITGCPKVRCMEIIAELEQEARGPYTGSMGYLGHDGSLDLNILIRTIVADSGTIEVRAGAGIVIDSVPERELEESRAKAAGMLNALV